MYKALTSFTDLQDNNHKYLAGDVFPRKGFAVTDERIAELSGSDNRRGRPVIKFVEEEKKAEPKKEVKKPTTAPKKTTSAASGRKKSNVK